MSGTVYEASIETTQTATTQYRYIASLKGSTTNKTRVKEIHIFTRQDNATAGYIGLCRSTALGTGTITSVTPVNRDTTDASATSAIATTNYGTAVPTNGGVSTIFRRWTHAGVGGAGIIWSFGELQEQELSKPTAVDAELLIVNMLAVAPALYAINFVLEE